MSMCDNKFVNICFDSNSQTSEPIRSLKSPTVDLMGEDLKVEEQERSQGTEEEGEQQPTNEDLDTSGKRNIDSDVWEYFTRKKVDGKSKSQGKNHLRNHLARCSQLKFKVIFFIYKC